MLEIKDIHKKFKDKDVLNGLTVNFEPGKIYGFLGNNGAGKTTMMRILFNMDLPNSGSITYNNASQKEIDYHDWFYFTETDSIPVHMSVKDYLRQAALLAKMSESEFSVRLKKACELINIDFKLSNKIKSLSSGQQKIMNCLVLLIVQPNVIFLDEPTANMDIKNQKIVLDIIKQMKDKNRTIVITTHLIKEVNDILTDVVILDKGVIQYNKQLKKSDSIEKIFDKYTSVEKVDQNKVKEFLLKDKEKQKRKRTD